MRENKYTAAVAFGLLLGCNNGNGAYRVDPENGDVTSYTGLVGAYTYSDMTGYALSVVGGFPPQG